MTKRNTRVAFIKRTPSPPPQLTPATWRAISMEELKSFNEKRLEKARDAHDFVRHIPAPFQTPPPSCEFDSLQIRSESLRLPPGRQDATRAYGHTERARTHTSTHVGYVPRLTPPARKRYTVETTSAVRCAVGTRDLCLLIDCVCVHEVLSVQYNWDRPRGPTETHTTRDGL